MNIDAIKSSIITRKSYLIDNIPANKIGFILNRAKSMKMFNGYTIQSLIRLRLLVDRLNKENFHV